MWKGRRGRDVMAMDKVSRIGCCVTGCHVIESWVSTSYTGSHVTIPSYVGHMGVIMRKRDDSASTRRHRGFAQVPVG